jgi:hypothetical protein
MAQFMMRAVLGLVAVLGATMPAHAQQAPGSEPPARAAGANANVPPTEQLFDGISMGSMETVRDAIGRGANLNARNVLGQRPVDLAIDIGRSDMAFLLLSMMRAGQPQVVAPPPSAAPRPQAPAARGTVPAARATPARLPTARLWANDGGTPIPELGFMGFDASRPDGARPSSAGAARSRSGL